jgi:hypothetical protein
LLKAIIFAPVSFANPSLPLMCSFKLLRINRIYFIS